MNKISPHDDGVGKADEVEQPRAVGDVTAGAAVMDAVEGGVGIHQAAEAHRRMPNVKAANVDTPSFQGHTFEQQATDGAERAPPASPLETQRHGQRGRHGCDRRRRHRAADEEGLRAERWPQHRGAQAGSAANNRLIQERALDKLDQHGHESGKVVTTRGDKVSAGTRVVESPVGALRVEQATERYAQALKGLSGKDVAKLAGQGAKGRVGRRRRARASPCTAC